MSEALMFKLVDMALNVVFVGLERDLIVSTIKDMEAAGASPDDVVDAIRAMRDKAIADAQAVIDGSGAAT